MKKSLMLLSVLLFAWAGILSAKEVKTADYSGYNIILVSFDALQAAHTGCLGYKKNTTPCIDSFAQEGILFSNAVSPAPWTVPATMSWFTSLYPSEHKCINKYSTYTQTQKTLTDLKQLSPDVITLAQVLKENGYATAGFNGDAGVSGKFGFNQGFDVYMDGPKFSGMEQSVPNCLEWLGKNKDKKFFIFLHGYDSHGQYDPPNGYTKRFLDFKYKGRLVGGKEEQGRFREEGLEKGFITLTAQDVRFWRALYDEKINDADARFAAFIAQIKKMGLLEKTIIVLAADHGTEFYEHKRFDHGFSLYDELIHVPLIFWFPGNDKGARINAQVRTIDIMPTLLELVGAKVPDKAAKQMKGRSLIGAMNGEKTVLDAYSETDYRFYASKRSIRTADGWKFIYTFDNAAKELYDLNKDPQELNNLADKEKLIAYELEQKLFSWLKSMGQDENYHDKLLKEVLKIKEY